MASRGHGSVSEAYALKAAAVVEDGFPPQTADDVYRLTAALNLLNAVAKQPFGNLVTSYPYIKGMAACLFLWLLYHPLEHVDIYWNPEAQLTYFRIYGRQFSFHYVPLLSSYQSVMQQRQLQEILWDGVQRQRIAVKLFDEAAGCLPRLPRRRQRALRQLMTGFGLQQLMDRISSMKQVEQLVQKDELLRQTDNSNLRRRNWTTGKGEMNGPMPNISSWKWRSMSLALKFNPWRVESFELTRRGDSWKVRVARYDGCNYADVVRTIAGNRPELFPSPDIRLVRGHHYFLRRSNWRWKNLTILRCLLLLAHYNYLTVEGQRYNLCITYALACHLGQQFPKLRFLNVLNYSRMTVHRRLYTYRALLSVPPRSKSRCLKVWMVVDREFLLRDFDLGSLPPLLWRQYASAPDYYQFFQRVEHRGRVGLVAYSRFHLLRTVYADIHVSGHYAQVMNDEGKWAIYSLMKERFESDFIYDRIWYDHERFAVMALVDGQPVVIHEMVPGLCRDDEAAPALRA